MHWPLNLSSSLLHKPTQIHFMYTQYYFMCNICLRRIFGQPITYLRSRLVLPWLIVLYCFTNLFWNYIIENYYPSSLLRILFLRLYSVTKLAELIKYETYKTMFKVPFACGKYKTSNVFYICNFILFKILKLVVLTCSRFQGQKPIPRNRKNYHQKIFYSEIT